MQALTSAYRNLLDTEFTWKQIMNADEIERVRNKFIFIARISIDSIRYRQLTNFSLNVHEHKESGKSFWLLYFFFCIYFHRSESIEWIYMDVLSGNEAANKKNTNPKIR